ncbi:MAG: hypothetical protein KDC07_08315 [Chitinophagaceae bacterium]|nr:hypothetical protein [Chitinophagaceae bacterium]MCB9045147.1 hypothetical protein [Chitinophagales bacterium]
MKKILVTLCLVVLFLGSCQKKQSTILPPVTDTVYIDTTSIDTRSVIISELRDFSVPSWGTGSLTIAIKPKTGSGQKVDLSLSEPPAKANIKLSSASGFAPYNTDIIVESFFLKPGPHPLKITCKTSNKEVIEYTVNIVSDTITDSACYDRFYSLIEKTIIVTDVLTESVVNHYTTNITIRYYSYPYYIPELSLYINSIPLSLSSNAAKSYTSVNSSSLPGEVQFKINPGTGAITIDEQTVRGRSVTSDYKDFKIKGTGQVDLLKNSYNITYTTTYVDSGNTVTTSYRLEGTLRNEH